MSSSKTNMDSVLAVGVAISDEALTVELSDGRTISVPTAWYPRLEHATTKERKRWKLISGGRGIHWSDLDEDISIANLLNGCRSGESQASLKKWLAQRTGVAAKPITPAFRRRSRRPPVADGGQRPTT